MYRTNPAPTDGGRASSTAFGRADSPRNDHTVLPAPGIRGAPLRDSRPALPGAVASPPHSPPCSVGAPQRLRPFPVGCGLGGRGGGSRVKKGPQPRRWSWSREQPLGGLVPMPPATRARQGARTAEPRCFSSTASTRATPTNQRPHPSSETHLLFRRDLGHLRERRRGPLSDQQQHI